MDCQHAMTHLFPYLDGEYELADRPAFEQHLSVCPECAARYRFERAIKSRLRGSRGSRACHASGENRRASSLRNAQQVRRPCSRIECVQQAARI
jgi:anti-sigma factor (TIGR02949 family)